MWLTKFFTAAMVILTGLLPSSCTSTKGKTAATKPSPSAGAVYISTVNSTNRDLGELALTNHYETCVQLGGGKSCIIKPNLLDRKNLQLTLSLQSKKSDGRTSGLSVTQIVTRPGKPFEVAIGDLDLTLTPELTSE
jgi:hypothetical protein